jgi:hypothetical protein
MRTCRWAGLLILLGAHPIEAQTSPAGIGPRMPADWIHPWEPVALSRSADRDVARAQAMGRGTKGAVGGALLLGTAAAMVRAGMCERGHSCTGPVIMWGLLGATVGAVVGGLVAGATE